MRLGRGARLLAVTGGMASGKSTVLDFLRREGIPVLSSDDVVHTLLRRRRTEYRTILRHFGKTVLAPNGEIDRKRLARIVFRDAGSRRLLEAALHPGVRREIRRFLRRHRGWAAAEIPLLYEAGWGEWPDGTAVVTAPLLVRRRRAAARGVSARDWDRRRRSQWPVCKKIQRADWILRNSGTRSDLRRQVRRLAARLKAGRGALNVKSLDKPLTRMYKPGVIRKASRSSRLRANP